MKLEHEISFILSLHRFLKVGNTPKNNVSKMGSWRQNMLKNVAGKDGGDDSLKLLPSKTRKSETH